MRPGRPNRAMATGWPGTERSGAQHVVGDGLAVADQRLHEAPVGGPVGTEGGHRLVERPECSHRRAPVDGLGEGHRGLAEGVPQPVEGRLAEEGGHEHHGVDGGAHVVAEAGQGQLLGAASPARVSAPSTTVTDSPAPARVTAAASPLGPDPTTTTSTGFKVGSRRRRGCSSMKFYRPGRGPAHRSAAGAAVGPVTVHGVWPDHPRPNTGRRASGVWRLRGRGTALAALYPPRGGSPGSVDVKHRIGQVRWIWWRVKKRTVGR